MTHQIIYTSEATVPMQADDLEELLVRARSNNATQGISGALVYAEGIFLQILEGDAANVKRLMATIQADVRHANLAVLRQGDIPAPRFNNWKMAYVGATPAQVARWAGIGDTGAGTEAVEVAAVEEDARTAQFAQDILSLLESGKPTTLTPE